MEGVEKNSWNGFPLAVEGQKIQCPKCRSIGVIKTAGTRISNKINGLEKALDGDLCICGCYPPPRLISNISHYTEGDASPSLADAFVALGLDPQYNTDDYEFRYRIESQDGKLPPMSWRIDGFEGKINEGVFDGSGSTRAFPMSQLGKLTFWIDPS